MSKRARRDASESGQPKRARRASDPSALGPNHWNNLLIDDTRNVIISLLDQLSIRLLGYTSKENHRLTRPHDKGEKFVDLLVRHGTRPTLHKYRKRLSAPLVGDLMYHAGRNGVLDTFEWLLEYHPLCKRRWKNALCGALENFQLECIKRCFENRSTRFCDEVHYNSMVKSGRYEELDAFLEDLPYKYQHSPFIALLASIEESNLGYMEKFYNEVLKTGTSPAPHRWSPNPNNLEVMKWCYARSWRPEDGFFITALKEAAIEVVEWLIEVGCDASMAATEAVNLDNLTMAKWLYGRGYKPDPQSIKPTSPSVLSWLVNDIGMSIGLEKYGDILKLANVPMTKILFDAGYTKPKRIWARNTSAGEKEFVMWLLSQGCTWSTTCAHYCLNISSLKFMKWLHSKGCPFDTFVLPEAIQQDNLKIVKWLVDNGCPFDNQHLESALIQDRLAIADYLFGKGCVYKCTKKEARLSEDAQDWIMRHMEGVDPQGPMMIS
jgi:hypothetical protein